MKFTQLKKEVKEFLENPIIFSKEEIEIFDRGLNKISKDIHTLIDGEDVENDRDIFITILNCSLAMGSKILDAPLHERLVSFCLSYSELIYNWNENVQKDRVLRQLCLFISRMCETRNEFMNIINTFKDIDDRMRDLSNWSPPSYEISKEYFEKLLEKNEKGKE